MPDRLVSSVFSLKSSLHLYEIFLDFPVAIQFFFYQENKHCHAKEKRKEKEEKSSFEETKLKGKLRNN